MLKKINPGWAILGITVALGIPTALAIVGKLSMLPAILVGAGSIGTLLIKFWRDVEAPVEAAAEPQEGPDP